MLQAQQQMSGQYLPPLVTFTDADAQAQAAAHEIALRLKAAIEQKGEASLVVSGGGSPQLTYKKLAQMDLQWDKITVVLADERWVETSSDKSNAYMIRSILLTDYAVKAKFIGLFTDKAESPDKARAEIEQRLQALSWPLDCAILGMGMDAHTLSLFPYATGLAEALQVKPEPLCAAITPKVLPENAPYPRMSMTMAALTQCGYLLYLLQGDGKKDVYEALSTRDVLDAPVKAVLMQDKTPVEVYWCA